MFWSEGFLKIFWRKGISLSGRASFSEKRTFWGIFRSCLVWEKRTWGKTRVSFSRTMREEHGRNRPGLIIHFLMFFIFLSSYVILMITLCFLLTFGCLLWSFNVLNLLLVFVCCVSVFPLYELHYDCAIGLCLSHSKTSHQFLTLIDCHERELDLTVLLLLTHALFSLHYVPCFLFFLEWLDTIFWVDRLNWVVSKKTQHHSFGRYCHVVC